MRVIRMPLVVILLVIIISITTMACTQATPAPASAPAPAPTTKPTSSLSPSPAVWQPVWKDGKLQPLPDGFPNGPITIWNRYGPGQADQIYGQIMATAAKDMSPVALGVENANTAPRLEWAMTEKVKGLPRGTEGYHIWVQTMDSMATSYLTQDRRGQTMDDLQPIIQTEMGSIFVIVAGSSPWKTLEEFTAYAKANKVRYGNTISLAQQAFFYLAKVQGFSFTFVPFSNNPQAITTMLGGGLEISGGSSSQIASMLKEGTVRALTKYGTERDPAFPNVPPFPQMNIGSTKGLSTRGDVPKDHVRWLYELFKKASEQKAYQDNVNKTGSVYKIIDGNQVATRVKSLIPIFEPILKDMGLTVPQTGQK